MKVRAWNSTLSVDPSKQMPRGAGPARAAWVRQPAKPPRTPSPICPSPDCRLFLPTDVEDVDPQLVCQCGSDWTDTPAPKRVGPAVRRSRELRPVSKARAAENRARRQVLERMAEADPMCQARIEGLCDGRAVDGHELKSRARGGSITDETNIVLLCRPCHRRITEEPAWAEAHGWALSQYEATDASEVA